MLDETTVYIWLDDIRNIPKEITVTYKEHYTKHSVNEVKNCLQIFEKQGKTDFILDLDHDLGEYAKYGGDAIKLVLWLIETGRNNSHYKLLFHTANPVGRENMEALYKRYWED